MGLTLLKLGVGSHLYYNFYDITLMVISVVDLCNVFSLDNGYRPI